jgi:hypothetical protein
MLDEVCLRWHVQLVSSMGCGTSKVAVADVQDNVEGTGSPKITNDDVDIIVRADLNQHNTDYNEPVLTTSNKAPNRNNAATGIYRTITAIFGLFLGPPQLIFTLKM